MVVDDALPEEPEQELLNLAKQKMEANEEELTFEDVLEHSRPIANYIVDNFEEANLLAKAQMGESDIEAETKPNLIKGIPTDSPFTKRLANIRAEDIGKLRKIEGFVITDFEKPRPILKGASFSCKECDHEMTKDQEDDQLKSPYKCEECGGRRFSVDAKHFADIQLMTLGGNIEEIEIEFNNGYLINDIMELRDMAQQSKSDEKVVYVTGVVQQEIGEDGKRHYKIKGKHIEVVDNPHEEEE
jgi:DNA replicative helicase MCM subunit Mcm2 (Cdc46/Mcm family)